MLSNITMGQYYPVDSRIHRLDPWIKLVLTVALIVAVFLAKSFAGYALILGFIYLVSRLANVPFRMLLRGLIFLIPAFILMPMFISPQGMWLAVPVTECMTLGMILLTNKGIISK